MAEETPIATAQWSSQSVDEAAEAGRWNKTINVNYVIRGAATRFAAEGAEGLPLNNEALFVPNGSGGSLPSGYRVKRRFIACRLGPTTWLATVQYGIPESGVFPNDNNNPLLRPWFIEWGYQAQTVPMYIDAMGRRVQNSAGERYDPPPTSLKYIETLTVSRYEPFFNRVLSRRFRNKTNSRAFTIGSTNILPGEAYCKYIGPVEGYDADADYIRIRYEFEIDIDDRERAGSEQSGYPFDVHLVDEGLTGYAEVDGVVRAGRLCDAYGVPLTTPVKLSSQGRPIDSSIKVNIDPLTRTTYAPVPNPNLPDLEESPFSTGNEVVLLFRRCREADFSELFE